MQKIKVGIIALAASAAVLALAGSAGATTQSASSPAAAAPVCSFACFDLYEDGVLVGDDVDVVTAIKFCYAGGLPPLPIPLDMLEIGQRVECYPYQGHKRWVIRSK
jgi:hypothetical protein